MVIPCFSASSKPGEVKIEYSEQYDKFCRLKKYACEKAKLPAKLGTIVLVRDVCGSLCNNATGGGGSIQRYCALRGKELQKTVTYR